VIFYRPTSLLPARKRLAVKLVEGLVENQKRILLLINKKPNISKRELSQKIGISTTAIDKNISALKKKGC